MIVILILLFSIVICYIILSNIKKLFYKYAYSISYIIHFSIDSVQLLAKSKLVKQKYFTIGR